MADDMEDEQETDLLVIPTALYSRTVGSDYSENSEEEEYVIRNNTKKQNNKFIVRQSQIRSKATIGNISLVQKDDKKDSVSEKEEPIMLQYNRVEEKDVDDEDTFDTPYSRRPTESRQKNKINDGNEDYECPLCTYMFASPCAEVFRVFKNCIDKAEESQESDDLQGCEASALKVHECSQKHGLLGYGKPGADGEKKENSGKGTKNSQVDEGIEIQSSNSKADRNLLIQKTNFEKVYSTSEYEEDTNSVMSTESDSSSDSSSSTSSNTISLEDANLEDGSPLSDNDEDAESVSTLNSEYSNCSFSTSPKHSSSDLVSLESNSENLTRANDSSDCDDWSFERMYQSMAEW